MECESAMKILDVLLLTKLEPDNKVQSTLMECILKKSGLNKDAVCTCCNEDGWGYGAIEAPYDMQDLKNGLGEVPDCLDDVYFSYDMLRCGIGEEDIKKVLSQNTEACAQLVDCYIFGDDEIVERVKSLLDETHQADEELISQYKKYLLFGCYYLISRIQGCEMEQNLIAKWDDIADFFSLGGICDFDEVLETFIEDGSIPNSLRNKEAEKVYLSYLLSEHLEFDSSPSSSTTPTLYLYWSENMAYYKKNRGQVKDASLQNALDKALLYLEDPVLTVQYREREEKIKGEDMFLEVSNMISEGVYFNDVFLGIYHYFDLYQSISPFTNRFYLVRNIFEVLFKKAFPLRESGNNRVRFLG